MYTNFNNYLRSINQGNTSCYSDCVKELALLCAFDESEIPALWFRITSSILEYTNIKVECNLKQAVSNWAYAATLWNPDLHAHLSEQGYCPSPHAGNYYDFGYSREYGQFNHLPDRKLKIYIQTVAMFETFAYYLMNEVAKDNYHWATFRISKKECTFGPYEVWDMLYKKYPVDIDWKFYDMIVDGKDFKHDFSHQIRLLDEYIGCKQYLNILPNGKRHFLHPHMFNLSSKTDEYGATYSVDGRYLISFRNKEITEYRVKDGTCLMNNFYSDNKLEKLTIPSSVVIIGNWMMCNELKTVHIEGNGLEIISGSAFQCCPNLSEIHLPDSVTNIDESAFSYCCMPVFKVGKNVRSLTGGDGGYDTYIPAYTFGNKDTYRIEVHEDNPNFCSIDGMLYSKDRKTLYSCPSGKLLKEKTDTIHIPEGTEILFAECLESVEGLKKLVLPSTIKHLGDCFVLNCDKRVVKIVCYAPTPPIIDGKYNYKNLKVRVPEEYLDAYEPVRNRFKCILGLNEPDPNLSAILMWKNGLGNMNKLFDDESPLPDKTRIATAEDLNIQPMPKEHITISGLTIKVSEKDMDIIRRGHIPECMEDHWFMYCDENTIRYYRSWTGTPVFEAHFEKGGGSYYITELVVNDKPQYYKSKETYYNYHLFLYLLCTETGHDSTKHWENYVRYIEF